MGREGKLIMAEVGSWKTEDGRPKSEERIAKSEDRRGKSEDRSGKTELLTQSVNQSIPRWLPMAIGTGQSTLTLNSRKIYKPTLFPLPQ